MDLVVGAENSLSDELDAVGDVVGVDDGVGEGVDDVLQVA